MYNTCMKIVYTEKEIELLAQHLGYQDVKKFRAYLARYGDMEDENKEENTNEKFVEIYGDRLFSQLEEIGEKIELSRLKENISIEDKILLVIKIVREFNKSYLLEKFKGKIDDEIAEGLTEYAYTHGMCNSLAYTLCRFFAQCENKLFLSSSYGHQCVKVNGMFYDINGVWTEDEMKDFVKLEGKNKDSECSIADFPTSKGRQTLIDFVIEKFLEKYLVAEREKEI